MKDFTDVSKVKLIQADKMVLPSVFLGTSVFLGMEHFGPEAQLYYQTFYLKPENIVKMVVEVVDIGIPGIHVQTDERIVESVIEAEKQTGIKLGVVATIGLKDWKKELDLLKPLEPKICFIHSSISDKLDLDLIEELISEIKKRGYTPGCATLSPYLTITTIDRSNLEVSAYMTPVNLLGRFMDKDRNKTLEAIRQTSKLVIANRVLAAGKLLPKDAFKYILDNVEGVSGIVVGASSLRELRITFTLARIYWSRHE
jgi:hypothetical protein